MGNREMSNTLSDFDSMGMTNNYWGICGVNSSLYALYQNNSTLQTRLAKGAMTPSMMLAEIKTFLRILQAEGKQAILDEIEAFTKTFKDFGDFTIQSYIERINSIAGKFDTMAEGDAQKALLADPKFSIGLPPDAVVFYMQRICGFEKAKLVDLGSTETELVVGLFRDDGHNMQTYKGLRHYVYYRNGTYYSWGKQFSSIAQMQRNYAGICYKIAL